MIFADLPVADCTGAILAHAVRNGEVAFKKGRVLSAADIDVLKRSGRRTITVARLEADDIGEDAAAAALGTLLATDGLRVEAPFTGRVNIYARERGILRVDAAQVDAINEVDEAITLATLADYAATEPDQMAATVKIIPFAVKRAQLDACLAVARHKPVLTFHAFRPRKVALIQTELAALKPSLLDKTVAITNRRLAAMGTGEAADLRAPHEPAALSSVIKSALADGASIVLVMGGSAIIDRRDVIPSAIEQGGGTVLQFGMPVDPGNLILLGEIGGKPVIGLPGCARTPKLNGFDWVLQRLMADIPVTARDLRRMGAGGLLNEIPARPQPRESRPRPEARRPRVAGLVMAAGRSSRMGANKLLMDDDGKPIVTRVVEHALAADLAEIVVVTGHQETEVRAALAEQTVRVVPCPDYADGMSASLRCGLKALSADIDAALILLGDMPRVGGTLIRRMIAAFNPTEGRAIIVPSFQGKRGNPVLWDRSFFGEMMDLHGDVGARHLIGEHAELVTEIESEDAGIFLDIDTPEAYRTLKRDQSGE
ncbi:NTP transferase domain-containing protein [Dongia deserti]|uniref:NTP transferase domain-containing protein n=1 Tax=Dongia deserti TaxID=2268030 RepID=UPI000E65E16F|nr:molybdopterin-binding/glycosyltransferase family 2 protein [Dongia deserti]